MIEPFEPGQVREVKGQMTSLRAWYHYYASLAYFAILPWYLSRR